MKQKKYNGFTLIELLVVISIIGLLATVITVSLNSARAKGRDAVRKATLSQLYKALELYYSANGSYPATGPYYSSEPGDAAPNGPGNNGDWIPGLAPTYISSLPREPKGGTPSKPQCPAGWKSAFIYVSDGVQYKLFDHCGPEGVMLPSDPFYDPARPDYSWMVCKGELFCFSR